MAKLMNRSRKNWHKIDQRIIYDGLLGLSIVLSIITLVILTICIGLLADFYFSTQTNPESLPLWGVFGDFSGAIFQTIVSIVAIFIAVVFTTLYQVRNSSTREAVKLSEMMYDRDFYASIVAPSWTIAAKWLNWVGCDGDDYRRRVIAGNFINFIPDSDRKFSTIDSANVFPLYRNYIPLENDHFKHNEEIILSEHMVLVIWLQFWNHVHFLIDKNLVDERAVSALLRDWYKNWYPFMYQYRRVGELIVANATSISGIIRPEHAQSKEILGHLKKLEDTFQLQPRASDDEAAHAIFSDVLRYYRDRHQLS